MNPSCIGTGVSVFIFLLSGLFCCLGFSGVVVFAVWAGACFFCCLGGGPGPAQTAKKKHAPAQTAKKNTSPPLPIVFFFCCLGGGRVLFFAVWAGSVVFFCCLCGGRVFFFAVWAGACSFFAVWAGACSFFLLFGPGAFFFSVWAGEGSSLTYPSAWLVFKRPNNKRDRTAKTKHGVHWDRLFPA